jgi:predicted phage terminase large subunit-like protein
LYVSATQDQADLHVQATGSLFERINVPRAVSKYGTSKGWRRNQLRTAFGFNVAAFGLDGAARGVKIDRYRPDLIIFDDIDSQSDSPVAVEKKIAAITRAIMPAGSGDCAVLFLQNLIHEDGVVSQLVDGRAEFLLDREVAVVEPAVRDLVTRVDPGPGGLNRHVIVSGEPTWAGQPLSVCQEQINSWGLTAFLREAQHEVRDTGSYFFNTEKFKVVEEGPAMARVCMAWDLAATEGGGDYTVGVLMGICPAGVVYVLNVIRGQHASDVVRRLVVEHAASVHSRFGRYTIRLPQDPGQAGKAQADQLRRMLAPYRNVRIEPVSGAKPIRARGWAEKVNLGNVRLLAGDWNRPFIDEHRRFREDGGHLHDDQVDAAADAFNELEPPGEAFASSMVKQPRGFIRREAQPWFESGKEVDDEE